MQSVIQNISNVAIKSVMGGMPLEVKVLAIFKESCSVTNVSYSAGIIELDGECKCIQVVTDHFDALLERIEKGIMSGHALSYHSMHDVCSVEHGFLLLDIEATRTSNPYDLVVIQ